ncbi:helix-turn-helix transcriptional regulator [Microbacterium sp. SSM24]|uniref:helix-turn-helix transcriptional regulator n=1 Tax=Microbacterium sp. SSM24 TaxID=2991714 RepID=UPI0022261D0B|nr:helix-turn-helix transcriptional regulator [Microbacterium sp. SSM24]MCW3492700.1 helix-turn-helix transcriptional regulator [Microbacterium sp. SSM24]
MDQQAEVREFLLTRRARLTPDRAGIIGGGRRRVEGLRREEVAMLAGMSVDYYARMERGNLAGVSPEVLDALARALQLDEAETAHLHDLAHAAAPAGPRRKRPRAGNVTIRPELQRLLDAITAPAYIANTRKDFLATNDIGHAVFSPIIDDPANGRNNARFTFLNPAARTFYTDWEAGANSIVASLRVEAGRNPHDKPLTDLIGELVTRSDVFRARWAAHDVRFHRTGSKRLHHPDVGDLAFDYEALELPADNGLIMFTMTPAVDTPTEERLRLLGSLAATRAGSRAADSAPIRAGNPSWQAARAGYRDVV